MKVFAVVFFVLNLLCLVPLLAAGANASDAAKTSESVGNLRYPDEDYSGVQGQGRVSAGEPGIGTLQEPLYEKKENKTESKRKRRKSGSAEPEPPNLTGIKINNIKLNEIVNEAQSQTNKASVGDSRKESPKVPRNNNP